MSTVQKGVWVRAMVLVSMLAWTCAALAQGDARAAIERSNGKWIEALVRGDASGIAALYTDKAQLLPANGTVVSGREDIRKYWQGAIDGGFKALTLTTVEVEACGSTAYEVGRWSVPGDDGKVLDAGDYVVIWKLKKGRWQMHRDTWTTNSPAPAQ